MHFAMIKREARSRKQKRPQKPTAAPIASEAGPATVVGGTKTAFITGLPDPDEPQPVGTIELPLVKAEKPEEVLFPEDDEFEYESGQMTEKELREMEEALFGNGYDDDLPEEHSEGISVEEMSDAYKVLHDEQPDGQISEEAVANVLSSLKGTDMFGMFINSVTCERKAKEIMDRHFEKYHKPGSHDKSPGFDIGRFME